MQIDELKVTVGEVCEGYFNDAEEGVVGYDERLDIRPRKASSVTMSVLISARSIRGNSFIRMPSATK